MDTSAFEGYELKAVKAAKQFLKHKGYDVLDVHAYWDGIKNVPFISAKEEDDVYIFWIGIEENCFKNEPSREYMEKAMYTFATNKDSLLYSLIENMEENSFQQHLGCITFNVISDDRAILRQHLWD